MFTYARFTPRQVLFNLFLAHGSFEFVGKVDCAVPEDLPEHFPGPFVPWEPCVGNRDYTIQT